MVERQQEHAGAKLDASRAAGDGGQSNQRSGMSNGIVVVLAEPYRVESRGFRALALAQGFVKARLPLKWTQPNFHMRYLTADFVLYNKIRVSSFAFRNSAVALASLTPVHRRD